ncbi:MAG: TonB-dependent receptor [Xanthomonadaceae bacterium]|nr:TonB-dependent receptor [Xanthomonadaceae bacterium]MDE2178534.1 TonB-dependent receptor [Xanthomonadaceae bacterium]MDE2244751.1 TonB-dependent receptor [Xanthomonadaceae bacterium]
MYGQFRMPLLDTLTANVSGRFDDYSDFGTNFSPAAGIQRQPIGQVAFRATCPKGFKAPSFAANGSSQTLGFVTETLPTAFAAAHGNDTDTLPYALGIQSTANPGIKPEESTRYTPGVILQPLHDLGAIIDDCNIKKTNVISVAPASTALNAYFAGQPVPAGYRQTPDNIDPAFPNAPARPLIVSSPYVNANSLITKGVDLSEASGTCSIAVRASIRSITRARARTTTPPTSSRASWAGTSRPASGCGSDRFRVRRARSRPVLSNVVTPSRRLPPALFLRRRQRGPANRHCIELRIDIWKVPMPRPGARA